MFADSSDRLVGSWKCPDWGISTFAILIALMFSTFQDRHPFCHQSLLTAGQLSSSVILSDDKFASSAGVNLVV
jgi:hypothetical protein